MLIKESVDSVIGKRVDREIVDKIKAEIMKDKRVLGVYDLVLTDYGPERYMGSVHIELDNSMSVPEIDQLSRQITSTIIKKYGVILHTIGIYSIDKKDPETRAIYDDIHELVFRNPNVLEMHGFSVDKKAKTIVFDIVIDFEEPDHEGLRAEILKESRKLYPDYNISIILDTDTSVS